MDKTTPIGIPAWRPLQPEETAHGLLLRLTELIGYRSPDWTAKCMGIKRSHLAWGRVDALQVFADTMMTELPKLAVNSPVRDAKGKLSVRGISLTKFMYALDMRRACPKCLADSAHHRFWWDILPVTTCPRHNLTLVDRCSCNDAARLGWRDSGLTSCGRCRKPLADTLPRITADPSVVMVDTYLLSRFGAGKAKPLPILDAISVWDALDTIERIGAAAEGYRKEWQSTLTLGVPLADVQARGFKILSESRLDEVLTQIFEEFLLSGGKAEEGFTSCYGWFYHWFNSKGGAAFSPMLADAFLLHGAARFPITPKSQLGKLPSEKRRRLSLKAAAAQCETSVFAMRNIGMALGLIRKDKKSGSQLSFPIEEVERIARDLKGALALGEVIRMLGVGHRVVHQLIAKNLLVPAIRGGTKHKHVYVYRRDDVATFIDRMAGGSKRVDRPSPGLVSIAKVGGIYADSTAAVLLLVYDGLLKVRERVTAANGLPALYIDPNELASIQAGASGLGEWSRMLAAKRMRLNPNGLKRAMRLGVLPGVRGNQKLLPNSAIEAFRAKHMMLVEVRQHLQGTAKIVKRLLKANGFQADPLLAECGHVGYGRVGMEAFLARVAAGESVSALPTSGRQVLLDTVKEILRGAAKPLSSRDLLQRIRDRDVQLGPSNQKQFFYATLWEERADFVHIGGAGWWLRSRPYAGEIFALDSERTNQQVRVAGAVIEILQNAKHPMSKDDIWDALRHRKVQINTSSKEAYMRKLVAQNRDQIAKLTGLGYWLRSRPYEPALYDPKSYPSGVQTNQDRIGAWARMHLAKIDRPVDHRELTALLRKSGIQMKRTNTRDYLNDALGRFPKEIVFVKGAGYWLKGRALPKTVGQRA